MERRIMIPTAEEMIVQYLGRPHETEEGFFITATMDDIKEVVIAFAKVHANEALKMATTKVRMREIGRVNAPGPGYPRKQYKLAINKKSILNAYPETLIR